MRSFMFIVNALILSFGISAAAAEAAHPVSFSNGRFNFKLQYPGDWTNSVDATVKEAVFNGPTAPDGSVFKDSLTMTQSECKAADSAAGLVASDAVLKDKKAANYSQVKQDTMAVGGKKWNWSYIIYTYDRVTGGSAVEKRKVILMVFKKDEKDQVYYVARGKTAEKNYEIFWKKCESILESLELVK